MRCDGPPLSVEAGQRVAATAAASCRADPAVERPLARRVARGDLRDPRPGATHYLVADRTSCWRGRGTRASSSSATTPSATSKSRSRSIQLIRSAVGPLERCGGVEHVRLDLAIRLPPRAQHPPFAGRRRPTVRGWRRRSDVDLLAGAVAASRRRRTTRRRGAGAATSRPCRPTTPSRPTSASEFPTALPDRPGDHRCWACNSAE